jgi:hypothetical protein
LEFLWSLKLEYWSFPEMPTLFQPIWLLLLIPLAAAWFAWLFALALLVAHLWLITRAKGGAR